MRGQEQSGGRAHEIGGNCIEIEADGSRLVLDMGWPITAPDGVDVPLPGVRGLADGGDPTLVGVVISHPHLDHFGLLPKVAPSIPIYIGEAASRIPSEAAFFSPAGMVLSPAGFLAHRKTFCLGPFTITPFLNDHSAYDAYSLLIEASGRRLFYTGDIRGHGRKAGIFDELLRMPPPGVDVLLMEGTQVREDSDGSEAGPDERAVEDACVETFRATPGLALALFSPQNIGRLVSVFRACLRSERDLVMDLYTAAIAQATGRETIPQADWDRVRVYLPRSQKRKIVSERAFDRTNAVRAHRIFPEELVERRGELAMVFRGSMARELADIGCLGGAGAVWSMWPGYLEGASGEATAHFFERHAIPMVTHDASGHATIRDLQRLVKAIEPKKLVPIHSFATDRFAEFFPRVDRKDDGVWWEV